MSDTLASPTPEKRSSGNANCLRLDIALIAGTYTRQSAASILEEIQAFTNVEHAAGMQRGLTANVPATARVTEAQHDTQIGIAMTTKIIIPHTHDRCDCGHAQEEHGIDT